MDTLPPGRRRRHEGHVAAVEQQLVGAAVADDHVEVSIAVDVAERDGVSVRAAAREGARRHERPVAAVEQQLVGAVAVADDHVESPSPSTSPSATA